MLNFLKKKDNNNQLFIKTAALLIHVAKIDENYSENEKIIIKKTLINLGVDENKIDEFYKKAENTEKNSNQILEFTKEIKNLPEKNKIKIIEALWNIIYSNKNADIYETNLMRRLAGLLYIDNKIMGDIKEKIKKNSR